jgi:uncharacterized repeat protein (TIGR01451 family)
MSNCKRRIVAGALVMLLLSAGCIAPAWLPGHVTKAIAAPSLSPDLVIESITLSPEKPAMGDTITFSVSVKNQGHAAANASKIAFLIDEQTLLSNPVETIDIGVIKVKTFSWTAQPGPHVFRAIIDCDNTIAESVENNNDKTFAFSVFGPDLIIESISWAPLHPSAGDIVSFTVKIKNTGEVRAGVSHVDFFIDGISYGHHGILGIEAGESRNDAFTWVATSGFHKVTAAVDVLNQVIESDESNNTMVTSCTSNEPDLIIESISLSPESPLQNSKVTFTVKVKNQGGSLAGQSSVTLYIDDKVLDAAFVGPLNPGVTASATFDWIVDINQHVFKATTDIENSVKESNESNNTLTISPWQIYPDLIIQDITWTPSNPTLNTPITSTITVKNIGKCAANNIEVTFSIDNAQFYNAMVTELPVNSTSTVLYTWSASKLQHTLKASVDELNSIKETSESNNTLVKTIAVSKSDPSADLIVTNLTCTPGNPILGEKLTVKLEIKNVGVGKANSSYADIYIDARLQDTIYINELEVGATLVKELVISLQGLDYKDTYELSVMLDRNNTVAESNETNNGKSVFFSVSSPDLIVQSIKWSPEVPSAGTQITYDIVIKNIGNLESGDFSIAYFEDDISMGGHHVDSLEPGAVTTMSFMRPAPGANFTFTAVADEVDAIIESNESNNSKTVIFPNVDLAIDSVSWSPANPVELSNVTFTAIIRNRGYGKATGTYVSCIIDGKQISSLTTGEIPAGGTGKVFFVYAFAPGEHTIKLIADVNDEICESNESNNEMTSRFSVLAAPTKTPSPTSQPPQAVKVELPTKTVIPPAKITKPSRTTLKIELVTPAPNKAVADNLSAPPPKWQQIIKSQWFIVGISLFGIALMYILIFLKSRPHKL